MAAVGGDGALAEFAAANGLSASRHADLPAAASVHRHSDGKVEAAASGTLPGGIEGTLAHFTWTETHTDADDHTSTERYRLTIVVSSIPESIGFAPYLGFTRGSSRVVGFGLGGEVRGVDLGGDRGLEGAHAWIYSGSDRNWQEQLFSPALLGWLGRCDEDFGFELSDGVLVAGRADYLTEATQLRALCEDAAHVAAAIARESDEEVDTGGAAATAAKDPHAVNPRMEKALAKMKLPPAGRLGENEAAVRSYLRTAPGVIGRSLQAALVGTLLLNIPGVALPIVLSVQGQFALLAAIEVLIFLVVFTIVYRRGLRDGSREYAAEAFFRDFAGTRGLKLEEPLHFAATHAGAKLPFKPERAMSGPLPGGGEGGLALIGDGSKRSDRIAVVGGPDGPVAEAGLESEPPGLAAADLDTYFEQLAGEVREAEAKAPAPKPA